MIGIRLLSELVVEINHMDEVKFMIDDARVWVEFNVFCLKAEMNRSLTRHRKISSSFRDTQLLEIFTLSCNLLKEANSNIKLILSSVKQEQKDLISHLLQLSLNCLLFDFIGTTSSDDTSDDLSTVQIPTSWRSG